MDEDRTICPPICIELWHYAYPYVWNLLNGGVDDTPEGRKATYTDVVCPDQQRVKLHIEVIEDKKD